MHREPMKPPSDLISKQSKYLLIFMASLLFLTLFSLLLFFSLSSAYHHHNKPSLISIPPEIQQACKATQYPESCKSSLIQFNNLPSNPNSTQIIQSAMLISTQNLKTAQSMVKTILDSSTNNRNRSSAAKNCLEVLHLSEYRLSSTADTFTNGKIKDSRAWMSASLQYQFGCWSGFKYVNDTQEINKTMTFLNSLIEFTSNALSMVVSYDLFGSDMSLWKPPQTERSGFWEGRDNGETNLGFKGGFPANLTADVTVCKETTSGCYKTVQSAVDASPENAGNRRFVIKINEGVYEEIVRVPLEKRNVVFLGDGMGKTVITGSLSVVYSGLSTSNTATVGVNGDGFMARDLTIQNTAGEISQQAVAFRSDSDFSIMENCEFLGNQDTLYARSLRQFYKSCRIEGNIDFIFGNSASVFQDCLILVRPRQIEPEKGETNSITAQGRSDPAQSTGFVFQNCVINGTDSYMGLYYQKAKVHKSYLGRPWKEFSRTVFIQCNIEALISPEGWMPWIGDFALSTLYYGEFGNSGAGANMTGRVTWCSQIPAKHVEAYSVQSFIQGDEWIPST